MYNYQIISKRYKHDLVSMVYKYMQNGWVLQGGVCHCPETLQSYEEWSQAMIKEVDNE